MYVRALCRIEYRDGIFSAGAEFDAPDGEELVQRGVAVSIPLPQAPPEQEPPGVMPLFAVAGSVVADSGFSVGPVTLAPALPGDEALLGVAAAGNDVGEVLGAEVDGGGVTVPIPAEAEPAAVPDPKQSKKKGGR